MGIEASGYLSAVDPVEVHYCISADIHRIVGIIDNRSFNLRIDVAGETDAAYGHYPFQCGEIALERHCKTRCDNG